MIHEASDEDIATVRELAERTWWPVYTPILTVEQITYMLNSIYSEEAIRRVMSDGSQCFLLLREEQEARAFASYGTWRENPRVFKIHKLYVLPEFQGKGYGRMLIDEILKRARNNGMESLALNVNRHNPALHFYRKYGFTIEREEDIPIGPYWMNDYVLKYTL